jgi:sec-independent protein translocase protein TatA
MLGRGFELFILILLVVVLVGAKRVPEALRNVGMSLRIIRSEARDLRDNVPVPKKRLVSLDPKAAVTRRVDEPRRAGRAG